jgi:hypothetical protein
MTVDGERDKAKTEVYEYVVTSQDSSVDWIIR